MEEKLIEKTIKIKGMHCKSCAVLIKDELDDLGVESIIDSVTGMAKIKFDKNKISSDKIKKVIIKEGYGVE
jgi:copper chaperone CopZ